MEVLSPEKRKIFAFNNIFTSVFLILIVLYLSIVNELYNVGKYNKFWLIVIISIFEVIKYIIYFVTQKKNLKTAELKHHKIINIVKSVFTISAMVGIYYIIAVLFGAPFMTHQEENLMFSLILTVLTVLPICLHCGHDAAIQLLLSITNYDGNELLNKFLFQIRSVFVGAWLGAAVIPLDWDRPYQAWPIPCYLGALIGYLASNIVTFALYYFKFSVKKFGKYNL